MKFIVSDTGIDFKSKQLIPDEYEQVNYPFLKLIKFLLFNKDVLCFHVRYLHLKEPIKSGLRYIVIFTILRIKRIPLIWSMHNYNEHSSKSQYLNIKLRNYLFKNSSNIIVYHKSIINKISDKYKNKIKVSNFGSVKEVLNKKEGAEKEFFEKYDKWDGAYEVDVIIVSAAKNNRYQKFVERIISKYNILIINANDTNEYSNSNIFMYRGYVYEGIQNILTKNNRSLIGMIFHSNISVATSYYLYSDFNIPVISNDVIPNSAIVEEYEMGISINEPSEINEAIAKIKNNYKHYSHNSSRFVVENTWAKGHAVYENLLDNLTIN